MSGRFSRRRLLAGAVTAAGVAAAASACGSGGGNTTLTIMGNHPSEITDSDVAGFSKKYPNVKIKFVTNSVQLLTAMFAAGDPPDIIRDQGVQNTPYLVKRDLAEDLAPYFAKSSVLSQDKIATVDDVWRYDGSVQGKGPRYGLAKDYSQDGMIWCNLRVFEKAKVDPPDPTKPMSYEEMLDVAKRITRRKGAQYSAYGLYPPFDVSLSAGVINMVTSAGGSVFNDDYTKVDFSAPEAKSALQWYLDYADAQVGPTVARPLAAGAAAAFFADQLGMVGYGYWFGGEVASNPQVQDHVRFITAPQFGSTRTSPCFAAVGHWIPKTSKHKQEAWNFFEWYFGEQPAIDRAKSGWGLPGMTPMNADLPEAKPYQKQALDVQNAEFGHMSVLKYSPYVAFTALDASLSQAFVKGLESGLSAGRLADLVNDTLNPLLEQGKELVA